MGERAPLRIALVHPYWWPEVRRGGERYLADLSRWLVEAEHQVDVITGAGPNGLGRDSHDAAGLTLRRRRHLLPGPLQRRGVSVVDAFGAAAFPALARRRYDVVHALTPTAALAARLAGQATVYTVLGHPTPDQYGRRPGDARLFRAAVRRAHAVAALSRASADAVERFSGRRPDVLTPGVWVDERAGLPGPPPGPPPGPQPGPPPGPLPGRPLRGEPDPGGTHPGAPRILYCSDASDPRKGLDFLTGGVERLRAERPEVRLVLAGPGDPSAAVQRLGAVVEVLDPDRVDLLAEYRRATLSALPSRHEAFGLVLVESLAAGTPVVCTDDGGMPEIVDRPEVGRVVPRDDVAALADALDAVTTMAADPATAARCTAHARRWDWDGVVGPAHAALYRRVASRR